jgi:hypothetical protein
MEEYDYSESCRRETQLAEFMDQTADSSEVLFLFSFGRKDTFAR